MKHRALHVMYTEIYVPSKLSIEHFSHAGTVLSVEYIQHQPQLPFLEKIKTNQDWKKGGSEGSRKITKPIKDVFEQRDQSNREIALKGRGAAFHHSKPCVQIHRTTESQNLFNFMRFTLAHFWSLPGSLWTAPLPPSALSANSRRVHLIPLPCPT